MDGSYLRVPCVPQKFRIRPTRYGPELHDRFKLQVLDEVATAVVSAQLAPSCFLRREKGDAASLERAPGRASRAESFLLDVGWSADRIMMMTFDLQHEG